MASVYLGVTYKTELKNSHIDKCRLHKAYEDSGLPVKIVNDQPYMYWSITRRLTKRYPPDSTSIDK